MVHKNKCCRQSTNCKACCNWSLCMTCIKLQLFPWDWYSVIGDAGQNKRHESPTREVAQIDIELHIEAFRIRYALPVSLIALRVFVKRGPLPIQDRENAHTCLRLAIGAWLYLSQANSIREVSGFPTLKAKIWSTGASGSVSSSNAERFGVTVTKSASTNLPSSTPNASSTHLCMRRNELSVQAKTYCVWHPRCGIKIVALICNMAIPRSVSWLVKKWQKWWCCSKTCPGPHLKHDLFFQRIYE